MDYSNLDRSLDEILSERPNKRATRDFGRSSGRPKNESRRRDLSDPRYGVKKSFTQDKSRRIDDGWVHDKYRSDDRDDRWRDNRLRLYPEAKGGSELRVDNLHYELTEEDLDGLFNKIGPVVRVELEYDRAGRSEGTAFVTYERLRDAQEAIREYDGANAAGQPIRVSLVGDRPGARPRNPFDTAVLPGRPMADRITAPPWCSRSLSPKTRNLDDQAARRGIDRYRPRFNRSRSPPLGWREAGRRPGQRRDAGGRAGDGRNSSGMGVSIASGRVPPKTAEQLDAEMDDYFGYSGGKMVDGSANRTMGTTSAPIEDIDMIE